MKVEHLLLLEFRIIYPDEDYHGYLEKANVIPRRILIDLATKLLRYQLGDNGMSYEKLLSFWFGSGNEKIANRIDEKIRSHQKDMKCKVVIVNEMTNLKIFEGALYNPTQHSNLSPIEIEELIFKIYLAYNQKIIEDEYMISATTKDLPFPYAFYAAYVTQSLKQSDLSNYNLKEQLLAQFVKAIYFFDEFTQREAFINLINEFYKHYKVNDYKDYLKRMLAICKPIFSPNSNEMIDLIVTDNEEVNSKFLLNLCLPYDINEDVDFRQIRSQPLINVEPNRYRIIFPLFVIEKIFNGLYFKLKELNQTIAEGERISNLRRMITYDFSERLLFYKLMERAYGSRYIQRNGEQISGNGLNGFVDYYIRNGRKVFLIESKDVLVNVDIKHSSDFKLIEEAIKSKLYYDCKDAKRVPKAILQLINSIKIILDGDFNLDNHSIRSNLKIYPIIILHNLQLDVLGLNQIVKKWFKEELKILQAQSYKIELIQEPVIMNIDSFILYADQLADRIIKLDELIDDFNKLTDFSHCMNRQFRDEQHQNATFRSTAMTFSDYLRNRVAWKVPKLFTEKGLTLFE